MIKIDDIAFLRLLPHFLQEEKEIQVMAQVIQEEIDLINQREENLFLYGDFKNLNEAILDELAYQWKTEGYEQSLSKDTKAKLVETSYVIRKTKGTRYAVEKTVKNIHGDFEFLEWHEYGGAPYHFKLIGDISPTGEKLAEIYKTINTTKNERSYLEGISVISEWENKIFTGALTHEFIHELIHIDPKVALDFEKYISTANEPILDESLDWFLL